MSGSWEDREVLQEVWAGKLPAVFSLAEADTELGEAEEGPAPCYLMLPRMSYLPLAMDKVKKHFSDSQRPGAQDNTGQMWFSYRGSPLRWHQPIGLLYDLLCSAGDGQELPWEITVHLTSFPVDQLLPLHTRDQVETVFMSALKEADQLKHSGKVVSLMQKKDHNQLWLGLTSDKFDQFWAINRKLMEPSGAAEEGFKHIPVRFHVGGVDNSGQATSNIVQRLISPSLSLGEVIRDMGWSSEARVVTQGVTPDASTPILWMSRHLSYPDNFLHIVIVL